MNVRFSSLRIVKQINLMLSRNEWDKNLGLKTWDQFEEALSCRATFCKFGTESSLARICGIYTKTYLTDGISPENIN